MIIGTCHCQAVTLKAPRAPETVTDCNCTICRRLGVLWAYFDPAEITVDDPDGALATYVWGDRMIAFHHCRTCGCTTHWSPLPGTDQDRMGLNARLFDPEVLAAIRVRRLDGADTDQYAD